MVVVTVCVYLEDAFRHDPLGAFCSLVLILSHLEDDWVGKMTRITLDILPLCHYCATTRASQAEVRLRSSLRWEVVWIWRRMREIPRNAEAAANDVDASRDVDAVRWLG